MLKNISGDERWVVDVVRILAFIVGLVGVVVIFGWLFDIAFLKSVFPWLVAMKFSTAVAFFTTGALLFGLTFSDKDASNIVSFGSAVLLIILMAPFVFSLITGYYTGFEQFFVEEPQGAVDTVVLGRPAFVTIAAFNLIAFVGIVSALSIKNVKIVLRISGAALLVMSGSALLGYIFGVPILYYYVVSVSTAIALNTAVLFGLIGAAFMLLSRKGAVELINK
ncbi:hypothetical protein J4219_08650 [Candidatus Woesearchaeota archaeon]|nr:hypothetical protein [Candidatus Woesearchaeota archaeon]